MSQKQHDYSVTLLLRVWVNNAESVEGAKQGAKDLIADNPEEHIAEAEVIEVKDEGESKKQY